MLLDGGIRVEYSGERSLEGMLEWLKKQENPFNRVNTVEELNGVREGYLVTVHYYGKGEGDKFEAWKRASYSRDSESGMGWANVAYVLVENPELLEGRAEGTIEVSAKHLKAPIVY